MTAYWKMFAVTASFNNEWLAICCKTLICGRVKNRKTCKSFFPNDLLYMVFCIKTESIERSLTKLKLLTIIILASYK